MTYVWVLLCFFLGCSCGWLLAIFSFRSRENEERDGAVSNQDAIVAVASARLGDQLEAGKYVLERERQLVASEVADVRGELQKIGRLVSDLRKERAEQSGNFSANMEQAFRVTTELADTTHSLQKALASSATRGQWGERMAEDVLKTAGFVEGINYEKQQKLAKGGVPDFSFYLPENNFLHMDVKFPLKNYMCWLESQDDIRRDQYKKVFKKDVRQRVHELTSRGYMDRSVGLGYVLLFVPNESVYGFLHKNDPELLDYALKQNVVLCSPTTLFAVLAVVRQSVENFLVEKQADQILVAVEGVRAQWVRWNEPLEKMRRGLDSAQAAFEDLVGPRARQFEKQLEKLEGYKQK